MLNEYPTIRRRIFSFVSLFVLLQVTNLLVITSLVGAQNSFDNGKIVIGSLFSLFVAFHIGATFWGTWRLSLIGMGWRHLIAGYSILNVNTNRPLNIFMLYLREIVCIVSALFTYLKVLVPAILSRLLNSANDDARVCSARNGDLYVSTKTVGQMRDDEMSSQAKESMNEELVKIQNLGFIHDRIFSTYAIRFSRMEALKFIFSTKAPTYWDDKLAEENHDQAA